VGLRLFGQKWVGEILSFMATSPDLGSPLLIFHVSYIWGFNRADQDEENLLLFDLSARLWPEIRAVKVSPMSLHPGYTTFSNQPYGQILSDFYDFDV
jgi:hypothetical protein